jgi:hypothetical protein
MHLLEKMVFVRLAEKNMNRKELRLDDSTI